MLEFYGSSKTQLMHPLGSINASSILFKASILEPFTLQLLIV
ncbi:MAG: hypothetical protein QXK12_00355 [Candidatus Nezhaarchaeales archaeon]